MSFEVDNPILSTAFESPPEHWYIRPGHPAERRPGRRPALVFQPRDQPDAWDVAEDPTLASLADYERAYELVLVNRVRERLLDWQRKGRPGATRISLELIDWWQREGREKRLFFAQLEAAETVIFLREARADFLQGLDVPREEAGAFLRYACKMATGAGKTTVMAMVAAWSILNKVQERGNAKYSDVVLVVCPNVTIRDRLRELDPAIGDASLYRTRDLVPAHLMPQLARGKVLVTNWHVFEPRSMDVGGASARVVKAGVRVNFTETVHIGQKTTTARGNRYMTPDALTALAAAGTIEVVPGSEEHDESGTLIRIKVRRERYVESDTALVARIFGREVGGKQNILVMNDEAHHAYRIAQDEAGDEELYEGDDEEEFFREATVWVEGLDRVQASRGINFCLDLSATPYYLGRVGRQTGRPFPWVVSDFGLIDAIESGLVKVPQLAVRDDSGNERPNYFNIWKWILERLTPAERGAKRASPKPEAILKHAHTPIAILAGQWRVEFKEQEAKEPGGRPPVFIIVCKNTAIAKAVHEWLADDKRPPGIPPFAVEEFRNVNGQINTIRVDTKVVHDTDAGDRGGGSKDEHVRWMRHTLDTVGKDDWPRDSQGRAMLPEGFVELAAKLGKALTPPGREVRCIVSVAMLTEGWDANTVTHIVGLRPFMSQLLCEQVVGRGLRRRHYAEGADGRFDEEVAQVLGVPFEVIPFKVPPGGKPTPAVERRHIYAVPAKADYEIIFPRVEGYTQRVRGRIAADVAKLAGLTLDPMNIPPEVALAAALPNNQGRPAMVTDRVREASLKAYRGAQRVQQLEFQMANALTRDLVERRQIGVPAGHLFPQVLDIVQRYVRERVSVKPGSDLRDVFMAPYYGWVIERLLEAVRPDEAAGESPEVPICEAGARRTGSTAQVDFWTGKPVREVTRCHLNFAVSDTARWEQSVASRIDKHPAVKAFVKNDRLGFFIPYLHDGQQHEYIPDFLVRLRNTPSYTVIMEVKGYPDPLQDVKAEAARRWVAAVNADGTFGRWDYAIVRDPTHVADELNAFDAEAERVGK